LKYYLLHSFLILLNQLKQLGKVLRRDMRR